MRLSSLILSRFRLDLIHLSFPRHRANAHWRQNFISSFSFHVSLIFYFGFSSSCLACIDIINDIDGRNDAVASGFQEGLITEVKSTLLFAMCLCENAILDEFLAKFWRFIRHLCIWRHSLHIFHLNLSEIRICEITTSAGRRSARKKSFWSRFKARFSVKVDAFFPKIYPSLDAKFFMRAEKFHL